MKTAGRSATLELTMVPATNTPAERAAAVRAVASSALDSDDCVLLLDMLGLNAEHDR